MTCEPEKALKFHFQINVLLSWIVGFRCFYVNQGVKANQVLGYKQRDLVLLPLNPTYVYTSLLLSNSRL